MKKTLSFIGIFLLLAGGSAFAQDDYGFGRSWGNNNGFIQPYSRDAYGPGIHSDVTGRPFQLSTPDGHTTSFERVRPNGYGPGVGMDNYGRPVTVTPWGR